MAESDKLLAGTERFAEAVTAGDVEGAKALYAPTRIHWERSSRSRQAPATSTRT